MEFAAYGYLVTVARKLPVRRGLGVESSVSFLVAGHGRKNEPQTAGEILQVATELYQDLLAFEAGSIHIMPLTTREYKGEVKRRAKFAKIVYTGVTQ